MTTGTAPSTPWTLEQAKNSLSEVVRRALDHQPQLIVRGRREEDTVVVVARSDYERLIAPESLVAFFATSPLAEAVAAGDFTFPDRSTEPARTVDF